MMIPSHTKKRLFALMLMAALTTPLAAQPPPEAERFINTMSQYLELADQVVNTAERQEAAIFLALEGIFEVYEQRKDAPGAIRHYEKILDQYGSNPTVRNLIRFKLRDIYKQTGQTERALEQLELIIQENSERG